MNRRLVLQMMLGSAFTGSALAQKVPTVAYLGSAGLEKEYTSAFRRGLAEQDYVIGQNIEVLFRGAEGVFSRLPAMFAEIKDRRIDALIVVGNQAALFAKEANLPIPIVFVVGGDPVHLGLAESYSKPTGNMTGVTFYTGALAEKRLEFLHELIPANIPAAILFHPETPALAVQKSIFEFAAGKLGRPIVFVEIASGDAFNDASGKLRGMNAGGFVYSTDPFFNFHRAKLVELAKRLRVPAVYSGREYIEFGGLMAYGSVQPEAYRLGGNYLGRVLKGERIENLPIVQSARFELLLNLKAAGELGISFTPRQFALADEVVDN